MKKTLFSLIAFLSVCLSSMAAYPSFVDVTNVCNQLISGIHFSSSDSRTNVNPVTRLAIQNKFNVVKLGDSMADFTSSSSQNVINQLKAMYGDAGYALVGGYYISGTVVGPNFVTTPFYPYFTPESDFIFGEGAVLYGTDHVNCIKYKPANYPKVRWDVFSVNLLTWTNGGTVTIMHSNEMSGTEIITVNCKSVGVGITNVVLSSAGAINATLIVSNSTGTNWWIGNTMMTTNFNGVVETRFAKGTTSIKTYTNFLAGWSIPFLTNLWGRLDSLSGTTNHLFTWQARDMFESSLTQYANTNYWGINVGALSNVLSTIPKTASFIVNGSMPAYPSSIPVWASGATNSDGSQRYYLQDQLERAVAISFTNGYFAPLGDYYPDFFKAFNNGLVDLIHTTDAGGYAAGNTLLDIYGLRTAVRSPAILSPNPSSYSPPVFHAPMSEGSGSYAYDVGLNRFLSDSVGYVTGTYGWSSTEFGSTLTVSNGVFWYPEYGNSLDNLTDFTSVFWIRTTNNSYGVLMARGNLGVGGWMLEFTASGACGNIHNIDGSSQSGLFNYNTTPMTNGLWHQVGISYDSTKGTIYSIYDGVRTPVVLNCKGLQWPKSVTTRLGTFSNSGDSVVGQYRDFKIYNRTLTSFEIQSDYYGQMLASGNGYVLTNIPSSSVTGLQGLNSFTNGLITNGFIIFGQTNRIGAQPPANTNVIYLGFATNNQGKIYVSSNGSWIIK